MSSSKTLLVASSVLAIATVGVSPATAAGTQVGTSITNNVTVTYKVGTVTQNEVKASNTFVVDRKIALATSEVGSAATSVSPGQQSAVTTFTVTNSSNDVLDFSLEAGNQSGGSVAFPATGSSNNSDTFDASVLRIYRETDNVAGYSAGDTLVTYLDQVGRDETVTVYVLANIPLGQVSNNVATVSLTATAFEGNASGSLGAAITETTGANTAGVDTVFADLDTTGGNVARDGKSLASDDYRVSAAAISATKTSRVISDPVNGTTDPKIVPGAVVEYCIAVANATGSADATNVAVADNLADHTTYLSSFGVKVNGTVTGTTCNADGVTGGNHSNGVVSGTLADIKGGEALTLVFRVTVD